jgi:hypothetical protein
MTIHNDGVAITSFDNAAARTEQSKNGHGDHLQQYRMAPPAKIDRTNRGTDKDHSLDFSAVHEQHSKPLAGENGISPATMAEIKRRVDQVLHGHQTSAPGDQKPLVERPEKLDKPLENFGYLAQPVYGANEKALSASVEKYGATLDYKQKNQLDEMISTTALGQTDKLKDALKNSTPETRNAFAEVMRKEMGLDVSLSNKENGGFDLTASPHSGLTRVSISQDKQWAQPMISSDWPNGKAPMNVDPWQSTIDSPAHPALAQLSDQTAKYRIEIGQTH